MTGYWQARAAVIDAIKLSDAVKEYARAMAGESDAAVTTDRDNILTAAALEVEQFVGRCLWQAAAGAGRTAVSELEVLQAPAEIPAYYELADTAGVAVSITTVRRWSDSAAAYETAPYVMRPGGYIRVDAAGIYELTVTLDPGADPLRAAIEGTARLFAFRETHRPRGATTGTDDGTGPVRLQGAMIKSGAAEALRYIRGPR